MRAAFSILGLVIAFALVLFLMKRQLPAAGPRPALPVQPALAASAADAVQAQPATLPAAVRQQIDASMTEAARRASEAQR